MFKIRIRNKINSVVSIHQNDLFSNIRIMNLSELLIIQIIERDRPNNNLHIRELSLHYQYAIVVIQSNYTYDDNTFSLI